MKSRITFFLLSFFSIVCCINSYANNSKIDPIKLSPLSNGTVACNSENPIPLIAGTFDNLTTSSSTSGVCVLGCGISNASRLVDSNMNNYATASTLLGLGVTHRLRATDSNDIFASGTFAGYRIAPSTGLISVDLLNSISIKTYLGGNARETTTGISLLNLSVIGSPGNFILGFNTNLSFDAIEITINSLAGVATTTNIYYPVIRSYCAGPDLVCNTPTAFNLPTFPAGIESNHTGLTSISLGSITNPEGAISSSSTDNASIILIAGVLGSATLAVKDEVTDYPIGTYAGFEIENINLVSISALSNVQIKTYLDGVFKEQFSGSNLLVNGVLLNASGRYKLGFASNTSFDEVQISLNQTLGVNLGVTKVYNAVFEKFCVGPALPCNTQTAINAPAYPVFINGVRTGVDGLVCVLCSVSNTENLIDTNPSNSANVDLTATVGMSAKISVKDQITDYPAGTFAGFDIESIALLNVNVFDAIRVTTFLNGNEQETKIGNGALISVNTIILNGIGRQTVGFVSTLPFDEIQIKFTNLADVTLGTVKVYNAILQRFCPTTIVCNQSYALTNPTFPVTIDGTKSGITGAVCAACVVNNANNVLTASISDFANIKITAGVIAFGSIAVADQLFTYPSGTFAGFTIKDINNLIETDLLQTLTISTYNNGNPQEVKTGGQLLNLSLLVPILGSGPGFYNVGFKATLPFDEIKISVGSLASVISNVNVYGAFVNTADSNDGGSGSLNCNVSDLSILKTSSNATPTIGSNITFTIVATNGGPRDATGVVVNDVLPSGYTFVSATASTGAYNSAIGIWAIGNLNSGANATLTITATVRATGNYANTATITGNQPDPNLGNNTSTSTPTPVNVIIANDDTGNSTNGYTGGTAFANVLINDTINGQPVVASQVNTTFVSSTNPGITLTGTSVNVAAGTPAGSYNLIYQICEIAHPSNCDQATVSVIVTAPVIDAVNDTAGPINGYTGGTFTTILANDTLNGQPVNPAQVNTTLVSSTNAGITLSGTTVNVASGTPAGSYSLIYQICQITNPTNCDQATVTVIVTAPVIDAVNDSGNPTNGFTGGTALTNVLANDTLNGQPVIPSQVNTTFVSSTHSGISLSGTNVNVAAGTPSGSYSLVYQICQITNPNNCDQATVTVTVTAPFIDAVNDTTPLINGHTGGTFTAILANDTLNGQPVNTAQVNTTLVISSNPGITLSGTNVNVAAGTPAGTYTLTYQICQITNPNNCDQATVTITVIAPIIDAVNDTGSAVSSTNGGTAFTNVLINDTLNGQPVNPSQITISQVATTNGGVSLSGNNVVVAPGTPSGSYILTYQICQITNPNNCDQATVSVPVVCEQLAAPTVSKTQPTCSVATGTITITAPLGTGLTYSINNSTYQSSTIFANLVPNNYNVTVKNGSGCISSATLAVINAQPATPAAPTVSITQPTCTVATATITVTAPTGSGLTYNINNGPYQSSTSFPGLVANTNYNVTVKNSSGCVSAITIAGINAQPSTPTASSVSITQPTCATPSGTITVTAPTGSGLTYSVNNGTYQSSPSFSGLTPNANYNVTVKNSNGCVSAITVATVNTVPATPAAPTIAITQPTCMTTTGTITITAPIGTGLTYSINNSNYQSGTSFSGLSSGSYNVTVKNSSGCTSNGTLAVVNNQPTSCNVAGIFHTAVTCTDFRNNSSSQLIGQLCYTTKQSKVANVTPGQFFYFTTITAPSASFCIDIVETKACSSLALFAIQQSNQITLYNATCSNVASGTQVSLGLGKVCLSNATPGVQYVLSVKYDSKSIVGATFSGTAPICQYNFESRINGVTVPGSTTSINLVPNCSATKDFDMADFDNLSVALAPNPTLDNFGLQIKASSDENVSVRIIDTNGRIIQEFLSNPQEIIHFGERLSSGLYFIEITQGMERRILKAQKL
ncbi:MAG: T9SS type A sorting domain-containing protein [Bacteroidota bacterium]